MQIHELNNFTGTLGSGAYLAVDDGSDTGKLSTQQLLAATEARIDNIIAGPAPSAEEIVDARLGDDGVTYPSLGDAIRDQVGDLKSAINGLESELIVRKYILTEPQYVEMQHLQINSSGGLTTNALYDSYSYYLNGLTAVKMSGAVKAYAFFTSAPAAGDTAFNGTRYTSIPDDGIITVPTGGTYILLRLDTGADAPTLTNQNEDEAIYKVVSTLSNEIDELETELEDTIGVMRDPAAITAGVFVEYDGDIQSLSTFSTTEPFLCDVGDYIYIKATGYSTQVSMISKTDAGFTEAEPLVISIDSTEREYTYKVVSAGYYCCSFDNRQTQSVILYKNFSNYALVRASNPLYGKSISSCGDSIAYGAGYADGYVGLIAEKNGMTFNNYGHSGWTMATGFSGGICNVVATMTEADFIMIEGGVNDYGEDVPLGSLTDGWSSTLDTTTFYGALEKAIQDALLTFMSSRIIYVITHVRKNAYYTPNGVGLTENDYWDAVRAVCHKYGIMIADVNRKSGLNTTKQAYRNAYTDNGDGIHPNMLGYSRYYVPVIEMAMKTLVD